MNVKNLILLISLFLIFSLFIYAEEKKVKLLWERKFDEVVRDMIVNEAEKTIIVITENKIHFLDKNGKVKHIRAFKREKEKPYFSKNGKHFIIEEIYLEGDRPYISSSDGRIIEYSFFAQRLKFFTPGGTLIKEIDLYKENFTQEPDLDLSKNGEYIILGGDYKDTFQLILLDKNGNKIWKRNISGNGVKPYISSTGDYIATTTGRRGEDKIFFNLLNKKGELLFKKDYPMHISSYIIFSPDEKYCVSKFDGYSKILFFQTSPPKLLWERDISPYKFAFALHNSCNISENGEFIIASTWREEEPSQYFDYILLIDKNGRVLWKNKIKESEVSETKQDLAGWTSRVWITPNGKKIYFSLPKGVVCYENKFAK